MPQPVTSVHEHELLPLSAREEWGRALQAVPHAHAHRWDHVAAFQASTGDPTYLYVGRDRTGQPAVVCPIAERRGEDTVDAYTPFGFGGFAAVGDLPGFGREWGAFAGSLQWTTSYVHLNPLLPNELGFPESSMHPSHELFMMDLRPGAEALLASMSRGRRRQLRRWESSPVQLTWDKGEVLDFMVSNAADFFQSRGASATYFFGTSTWALLLEADSVIAVGAKESGRVVSVVTFGLASPIADALLGASLPGSEALSAPLLWEGVKALKERGIETLNTGGGVRPDDGIAAYKRLFGCYPSMSHSLHLVHDEGRYAAACRERDLDSAQTGGYFPPYRRLRA